MKKKAPPAPCACAAADFRGMCVCERPADLVTICRACYDGQHVLVPAPDRLKNALRSPFAGRTEAK